MKKAFDQTVRDIKREVNKKVLKVPGVEQKVLDATSNEPWGPHGSLLADIAQATRNYNEYQIIMVVIWKRINDTGKNWRHVYKALTVLEYLVAHGSDRVIDEIKEHSYQISTLSDFQYIDSGGRDQGSNVRKKSQSLVVLANDKERIQEVRQKAAANRDKFHNASMGGMHRHGSYSSTGGYDDDHCGSRDDDRYGSRDDDRNGHGREREYRDDDRYGRYGDSYGRDGERHSRDSDERYGRDGYRDDDSRGRSRSIDDSQYGSRSRSANRERDCTYGDDGQYSARGSGAKADDHSQEGSFSGRPLERKYSEQNLGAPPSYEEAVSEARSPVQGERVGETPAASAPKTSVPPVTASPQAIPVPDMSASSAHALDPASPPAPAPAPAPASPPAPAPVNQQVNGFDEFDPRGSFSAAPTTSNGDEFDLLGSLSESFSSNPLAIMPNTAEANAPADFSSAPTFAATPSASTVTNQPFEDPFGDGPFRALPSTDGVTAPPPTHNISTTSSFDPIANQSSELTQPFGDTFPGMSPDAQLLSTNAQFSPPEVDILADILPPSGPSQTGFPVQASQPASMVGFSAQAAQAAPQTSFTSQTGQPHLHTSFLAQALPTSQTGFVGQPGRLTGFSAQPDPLTGFSGQMSSASHTGFPCPSPSQPAQPGANFYGNFLQQPGSTAPAAPHMVASQTTAVPTAQYNTANFLPQTNPAVTSQMAPQAPGGPAVQQHNNDVLGGNFLPQAQPTATVTSQPALTPSTGSLAIVPQQPDKKFEPKSSVWADTLNRGLVNFNISGPKTNPLADIGIDFEAMNRKEKRMEKQPTTATVTSTITMGKAMGSGSGIGRAGANALRPSPNAMVGSGMGMGMGGGPGAGMGVGGGPGAGMGMGMGGGPVAGMGGGPGPGMGMGIGGNPRPGMGLGMGGGLGPGMGMGMGMGMGGGPGPGMGMGMGGGGAGPGMGMGGYGGMNQPMGMGGYGGMNQQPMGGMGMNMGMGIGQEAQMQPSGFPPASNMNMPGGYNPMMGRGNYGPQQPYGGGYR
ncbi:clathrin interactor EPSIN 2-like isoform X2 [Camellia sinensis]|uniref:clathrin interactor EPSIN 2-like isoform X2 n=1 Tax=Camellia sinensis TaxID=4442 RepID=UPI0010369BC2|nr:clathrin interactor EPSIN 2-like isoform X2 [Camellia sinensis]